jgi:hypothetical protein
MTLQAVNDNHQVVEEANLIQVMQKNRPSTSP